MIKLLKTDISTLLKERSGFNLLILNVAIFFVLLVAELITDSSNPFAVEIGIFLIVSFLSLITIMAIRYSRLFALFLDIASFCLLLGIFGYGLLYRESLGDGVLLVFIASQFFLPFTLRLFDRIVFGKNRENKAYFYLTFFIGLPLLAILTMYTIQTF